MANQPKSTVIDPDRVPETLCDGRFFIHPHGHLATLTFTMSRPEAADLASGSVNNEEIVRARITMPLDNFVALRDMLNSVIKSSGSIPATGASSDTNH